MEHPLSSRAGAGCGCLPGIKELGISPLLAPVPPLEAANDSAAEDGLLPPEGAAPRQRINTTDRVLKILLEGNLARMRADSVAEALGMSGTTLRRRLRADHTCYQFLLDRARQYRCEQKLKEAWLPGKCLADELGYLEVNSFYRAFRRWTGLSPGSYRH